MLKLGKYNIRRAQQCLYDNGIDADETATVLQALGYILLDKELDDLLDWDFEPIERSDD